MVDPGQIIDELAGRYLPWFVASAGLDEKGPEKNDITDSLTPSDWWTRFDVKVSMALSLSGRSGAATPASWISDLEPAIVQSTKAFQSEIRPLIQERVQTWISSHPERVLQTTEEAIARFGLKVTGRMLLKLAEYFDNPTEGVVAELRGDTEMGRYVGFAQQNEWKSQLRIHLDETSKSRISEDHPSIHESVLEAMKYSTCISKADVCEKAADLLADFAHGFIRPLAHAINDAASQLDDGISTILDWPTWAPGPPPLDLVPPKSEWTVIEPDEFNDIFLQTLAESVSSGGVSGSVDQQRVVRDQVVSGKFIRDLMESSPLAAEPLTKFLLLGQSQKWMPDFRISNESARTAVFHVNAMPEEIAARADAWMNQKGTPFELLFSSTLRSYTAHEPGQINLASPSEYKRRQQRFIQKFQAAVNSSAPLVGLNSSLIGLLHPLMADGGSVKITRDVTQIPFLNHPIDAEIRTELASSVYAGQRSGKIAGVMVNDTHLPHIDVISQLDAPVSPLVIESLMKPISNAWAMSKNNSTSVAGFWSLRRARTLKEFIPVPQEHLRAMVRGWFTAQLLGLIDVSKKPYSIYQDPLSALPNEVASFPDVFLSASAQSKDQLPLVLEALSLAYAEVGNQGNLSPLRSYIALRDYGRMDPQQTPEMLSYELCNPVLQHWIDHGTVPQESKLTGYKGVREEIKASTKAERVEKAQNFLEVIAKDYSTLWEAHLPQIAINPAKMSHSPYWPELYEDIQAALGELRAAVASAAVGSGTTDL
jgi:hypothetical protein